MTRVVTANDILDGHVGLDLECFDRIYLNVWGPNLQVPGQVVGFLTGHLGSRSRRGKVRSRMAEFDVVRESQ